MVVGGGNNGCDEVFDSRIECCAELRRVPVGRSTFATIQGHMSHFNVSCSRADIDDGPTIAPCLDAIVLQASNADTRVIPCKDEDVCGNPTVPHLETPTSYQGKCAVRRQEMFGHASMAETIGGLPNVPGEQEMEEKFATYIVAANAALNPPSKPRT